MAKRVIPRLHVLRTGYERDITMVGAPGDGNHVGAPHTGCRCRRQSPRARLLQLFAARRSVLAGSSWRRRLTTSLEKRDTRRNIGDRPDWLCRRLPDCRPLARVCRYQLRTTLDPEAGFDLALKVDRAILLNGGSGAFLWNGIGTKQPSIGGIETSGLIHLGGEAGIFLAAGATVLRSGGIVSGIRRF
jgi:hypothetical protein